MESKGLITLGVVARAHFEKCSLMATSTPSKKFH